MRGKHWLIIQLLVLAGLLGLLIRADLPSINEEEHMTEYFRINGLNNIVFDGVLSTRNYDISGPVEGMSDPLTREEVVSVVDNLPLEIRGHVLGHGLSIITVPFQVWGTAESDSDLEDNLHDIHETMEDAKLYIGTEGARGTRAVFRFQLDNASQSSYKTVYWGEVDEQEARTVFDSEIRCARMEGLKLTLYCEPHWRPSAAVTLGPNEIYCPSFEENADSGTPNEVADNWTLVATLIPDWESTIVLHDCYSQELVTDAVNEGIDSTAFASGAVNRTAVAYAWIYKSVGGEVRVQMWETGVAMRAEALLSTPGWQTAIGKDGASTWSRVVVSGTMPNNANHHFRIIADDAATTFYVDKCYWEWDTLICPDEWIGHRKIYNHYDARWLPNYPGGAIAGDAGHINYVSIDDLKGDVDARIQMRVEYEQKADDDYALDLYVGRRSQSIVCNFMHWFEAEDGALTNWPAVALARCSAGAMIQLVGGVAAGSVLWDIGPIYGNLVDFISAFDIFAIVKTNDKDNTQYRAFSVQQYGPWRKQDVNNKWQMIHLGNINLGHFLRAGVEPVSLSIGVEYAKDIADTVELDAIWLVPKMEPGLRLESAPQTSLAVGEWWAIDSTEEFNYDGIERNIPPPSWVIGLNVSGAMTLKPWEDNRLYFVCLTKNVQDTIYEAHGAATDLQMIVSINYLPQYISPLE